MQRNCPLFLYKHWAIMCIHSGSRWMLAFSGIFLPFETFEASTISTASSVQAQANAFEGEGGGESFMTSGRRMLVNISMHIPVANVFVHVPMHACTHECLHVNLCMLDAPQPYIPVANFESTVVSCCIKVASTCSG